ncbi:MAG: ketopantoate reductase family protein [Peptostreptococcales bacterium]
MNIVIVGMGAIGTTYATLLKNKGHKITAWVKEDKVAILKQKKCKVTGIWGEYSERLDRVISKAEEIGKEEQDLILIAVKSFDTLHIAKEIAPLVTPNTKVILLQNGLGNYEAAATYIPKEQILLARLIFGAVTVDIGESKVTAIADDVILGSPEHFISKQDFEPLVQVFKEAGIPTRYGDDIMMFIWGKVVYNASLNPLGALFRVSYGEIIENRYTEELVKGIIIEIFNLLEAIGQKTLWHDADEYLKDFYANVIPRTATHQSSMLQDIQSGRKTEIDYLNGAIVELGKKYNLDMKTNEFTTSMIRAMEEFNHGKRVY